MYSEILFARPTGDRVSIFDLVHTGAGRALPDDELEPRHRVGITLADGFNAPVGQIADRTREAFAAAGGFARKSGSRRPARAR